MQVPTVPDDSSDIPNHFSSSCSPAYRIEKLCPTAQQTVWTGFVCINPRRALFWDTPDTGNVGSQSRLASDSGDELDFALDGVAVSCAGLQL